MATILYAWELGGGLGHLTTFRPVAEGLLRRGHRLFAALRDLSRSRTVLADQHVTLLQAPLKTRREPQRRSTWSYADILAGQGYSNPDELSAMLSSWRALFDFVRPDLVIADHCPTGLLALQGLPARRVLLGTGFCAPPDVCPLPPFDPLDEFGLGRLRTDEDRILTHANQALADIGQPPLARLGQLFSAVDENFLTTFSELDHYPNRTAATNSADTKYWGAWESCPGLPPIWPAGEGPKVFAYVKPFPALADLLQQIHRWRLPTLVSMDGLDARISQRFESESMHFEPRPFDLARIAQECQLAITNAGHGAASALLLAGKPLLLLPLFQEQLIVARNVERLGAGRTALGNRPREVLSALHELLDTPQFAEAASQFSARYADLVPQRQIEKCVERIEGLLHA